MAKIICHHNGRYNVFTTAADGFCYESSLSLSALTEDIRLTLGQSGIDELPNRLERAHKNGHSGHMGGSLNDFLSFNRAGDNEAELTFQECIDRFLS